MIKKVYLAGPFFNDEQIQIRDTIYNMLLNTNFDVFSPGHVTVLNDDSSSNVQKSVFNENLKQIDNCDFIIAIGNSYDTGTMVEIGYALKANKPVIYFNNSNDGKRRNLMLAGAALLSFTHIRELFLFLTLFDNKKELVQ